MKLKLYLTPFLRKVLIILLITCVFLPENSFGQQPLTRKISFLDGLPSDVVYDLFVDKGGLLYLGTDKGLVSYDGVHFNRIEASENLGNSIGSLQEDKSGVIWCKNLANQLFYLKNNQLNVDKVIKNLLLKSNSNLIDFCLTNNGMYILTQNAVYLYKGGKIELIHKINVSSLDYLTSLVYDKDSNKLYVASTQFNLTFKNGILIKKQAQSQGVMLLELFKNQLTYCFKTLNSGCVVGKNTISVQNPELKNTFFNRLSATKDHLWLCTNNGIYEFNERQKSFEKGFLKGGRITDIVQDLEGNHWISSLDEGLYLLPNRRIFELNSDLADDKRKTSYTRIAQFNDGNYFVGTNDGRIVEITALGIKKNIYDSQSNNTIEFINFIGDTILTNYGLFRMGSSKVLTASDYYGKALEPDNRGNLLLASPSFGGIIAKDFQKTPNFGNLKRSYKIIKYGVNRVKTLVLREKRTRTVLFNSVDSNYYFGFVDGLFVYDNKGSEKEIKTAKNEPIIAMAMLANDDGSIWIASLQRGLLLIKNNKIVKQISRANGLSDNNCRRIQKDKSGIWIVTETGFDFYSFTTNRVKNAQLNLCIKGITINDLAVLNKTVALATNQGIYYFDKKVLDETTFPRFKFTNFQVNGIKINVQNETQLKADQNNINIEFNTIHYKSLGNYKYSYRLKGLDDKWYVQSSVIQNINYLALNPGSYKFQIKVKIGEYYTPIQEINFEISKPFWLQSWFLSISIMALLALLYLVYRWAVVKTQKSEELKELLALSQLTALRSQMNPHFIFNVLNAVQGLIYSNQKSKASDYLGQFSDLMRRILDFSDTNEVTIEKEFETIELYVSLEKARFEEDFEYSISFPEGVDLSQYTIPSMIIQPFVENAIKHGLMHKPELKILSIRVELFQDLWCFTIDDNGIGRKASEIINQKIKKHISFATKAIDNRLELIRKTTNISIDIEVIDKKTNDEVPLGTRIKIYIPIIDK